MWTTITEVKARLLGIESTDTTRDAEIKDFVQQATAEVKMRLDSHLATASMPAISTLLASTTAATTMSITGSMTTANRGRKLRVVVNGGTTGSGTVTVTGTIDDQASRTETLTFTANGTGWTTNLYTAASATDAVTTTGLADETAVATVAVYEEIDQTLRDIVGDMAAGYYWQAYGLEVGDEATREQAKELLERALDRLQVYIDNSILNPESYKSSVRYRRSAS